MDYRIHTSRFISTETENGNFFPQKNFKSQKFKPKEEKDIGEKEHANALL